MEFVNSQLPYVPDYVQAIDVAIESSGSREKLSEVKASLKQDLSEASKKDRAKTIGVLAAWAWEWGPLNELAAAYPSLFVLESTHNPIAAGVVGGAIYAAQQGALGLITAGAIDSIPKTAHTVREEFNTTQEEGASLFDKAYLLTTLGTSAMIVNEHVRDKERTFKKDAKLMGKAMAFLVWVDVLVFTGANVAIENADEINMDPNEVVDIATNPLTWIGVFGLIKATGYYRKIKNSGETSDYDATKTQI